jgi:molybdopterin biosynthesis enzyme MoaB
VVPELLGGLEPLLALLSGNASSALKESSLSLLLVLSMDANGKALIREADGIPPLVRALQGSANDNARQQALLVLGNLAQDSEENAAAIQAASGLHEIIQLLSSPAAAVSAQAANTLAALAQHDRVADALLGAGGLQALVQLLPSSQEAVRQNAAKAIAQLLRRPPAREAFVAASAHAHLPALLSSSNAGLLKHALVRPIPRQTAAISLFLSLSLSDRVRLQMLVATLAGDGASAGTAVALESLVGPVAGLLSEQPEIVVREALGAALALSRAAPRLAERLIDFGVAPHVVKLLSSRDTPSQARAAELLSFWSSSPNTRAPLRQAGAVGPLVECVFATGDEAVQLAVLHALSALAQDDSDPTLPEELLNLGAVLSFSGLLACVSLCAPHPL